MLSPDVRFEGFTYEDWQRVSELFRPRLPSGEVRPEDRPRGLVIALHRNGRLRKLLHSQVGRLRLDDLAPDWPISPQELARRHDASWALSLEVGALDDVMEAFGARSRRGHDLSEQWLLLLQLMQEQVTLGRMQLWPERLTGIPLPTKPMIDTTLDMVCPRGKTMLIGLFEGDSLWTSIALKRGYDGIERILGPDEIRPALGLLSGDFRRDHRHLARVVSDYVGPLSLGCFAEQRTFRSLEVDPTPGAWARAVAVRDIVLNPVPPAMAVPLGIDAGRAAFGALRHVAARIDTAGLFGPAMDRFGPHIGPALGALRDITLGQREVEDVFGFNPLVILRKLLARER